jgi:hypothetical protein
MDNMDHNNEQSGVVFEGEEFQPSSQSFQTPTPKIIEWVIKYSGGYINNGRQASYVLFGFVVSLVLAWGGKGPSGPDTEPYATLILSSFRLA